MMTTMPVNTRFDRFVAAVHRRAVAMRVIEGFGVGLAIGAGVALFVVFISLRGGMSWTAAGFFAGWFVFFATLTGWQRRPSRLAALIEADRQLKLDDLLSSALTARDDDFGRTVKAMAERAVANLSPSQVILNRFGARAWGGIGLAWATVIVLGLLIGQSTASRASDEAAQGTAGAVDKPGDMTASSAEHSAGRETGVDENRSTGSSDVEPTTPGRSGKTGGTPGESVTGSGGGQAQTSGGRVDPTQSHATPGGPASPGGETASGVGAGQPGTGSGRTGGLSGDRRDHQAPPWQSDHWPADRSAALQSVHDGRVPDVYRDLVRDYFNPEKP